MHTIKSSFPHPAVRVYRIFRMGGGQASGRSMHYVGGRCRQVICMFFTVAVIWDFLEWTLGRRGHCMQVVAKAGVAV